MKNQNNPGKSLIITIGLLLIIFSSCKNDNITLPTTKVTTTETISIGSNAVTISSKIINEENETILNQGVCWSTQTSPTLDNDKKAGDMKDNIISCRVSELTPNTRYYARTFVTTCRGTFYGDEIAFTTNNTVTDQEGNVYSTVTIGTQVWMVENLKTTIYNDGLPIPFISENSAWSNLYTAAYCWYENDQKNKNSYGALYNWGAVNSGKLCPKGWHVPTDAEWTILIDKLGGMSNAAGQLQEVGMSDIATNYSGFSAIPSGSANAGSPTFIGIGIQGRWWTSTIDTNGWNVYWSMSFDKNTPVIRNGFVSSAGLLNGLSVRCIKDK